jgi:hypothetical protein
MCIDSLPGCQHRNGSVPAQLWCTVGHFSLSACEGHSAMSHNCATPTCHKLSVVAHSAGLSVGQFCGSNMQQQALLVQ